MALTFAELKSRVLAWMDDSSNTGSLSTIVGYALNDANAQRATEYNWRFMKADATTSFTCTSATSYTLSTSVGKPLYFYNTNQKRFVTIVPDRNITINDLQNDQLTYNTAIRAELRGENQTLHFLTPPAVGDVITYDYYKLPTMMTSDGDYPDIPFPHSLVLVWDTLINLKAYTLEPDAITIWQDNQQKALTSLYTQFGETADVVGGEAEHVHFLE